MTHKMDPYTANHQATQACPGSVAARGRKNLACQNLHSRLPRLPRLGLSDLTTRLSTQSGYRCQLNCVRSRSYVSITATSEIPLSSCLPSPKTPSPSLKSGFNKPWKILEFSCRAVRKRGAERMQASGKEALPLFGTLAVWGGERGGKGIDCDVARVHFSQFWISRSWSLPALGTRGASGTAE